MMYTWSTWLHSIHTIHCIERMIDAYITVYSTSMVCMMCIHRIHPSYTTIHDQYTWHTIIIHGVIHAIQRCMTYSIHDVWSMYTPYIDATRVACMYVGIHTSYIDVHVCYTYTIRMTCYGITYHTCISLDDVNLYTSTIGYNDNIIPLNAMYRTL